MKTIKSNLFVVILGIIVLVVIASELMHSDNKDVPITSEEVDSAWVAPSIYLDVVTEGKERDMVIYGEELIRNTAKYLGPQGSVAHNSNSMNCQNCHLDAGRRAWGNNFGGVYSTYPLFRERSGKIEDVYRRINDCFERSMNGETLPPNTKEMQAMYTYINWVGKEVKKGTKPTGSGLEKLAYINRAASPANGQQIYNSKCASCHGTSGEGLANLDGASYTNPPLWGPHSYNDGAGMYRLSNFASFIKNNMPYNQTSHKNPVLSLEEAWDVAAFVNSQPRPHKDFKNDYPNISKKPVDAPFGPYADTFSQQQHKYGPFQPIAQSRTAKAK